MLPNLKVAKLFAAVFCLAWHHHKPTRTISFLLGSQKYLIPEPQAHLLIHRVYILEAKVGVNNILGSA